MASSNNYLTQDKHQVNDKKEAEEKFKLISEAYSVLSDPQKKQEYDTSRKFGGDGADFSSFNFRKSNFDPFDVFKSFFGKRDPFFDDDDDFGLGFGKGKGMGKFGFDDFEDDFFKRDGFGNFQFSSSSSTGGFGGGVSTSIKKTTQIM